MPRTRRGPSAPLITMVKPTYTVVQRNGRSRLGKMFKISLFKFLHDNNYGLHTIGENLVLDWLVVQLRLQFFAISNFSNSFVEILVDDVLPLSPVNISVISEKNKLIKINT